MSNLKKALYVLLNDISDSADLEIRASDEIFVDYIINALIEKNEMTCPFKNYDCIGHCKANHIGCVEGLDIDCNREREDIWKEFIGINNKKGEY